MPTAPQFVTINQQAILDELILDYQNRTGRVLAPAQVERLILDMMAFREGLTLQKIQDTALQNLVDFSRAPFLDYLGALLGVNRLAATGAVANFTATLVTGHGGVTIPAGTRISSPDGLAVFITESDVSATIGVNSVTVDAVCTATGSVGNNYAIGGVNVILDPQAFLSAMSNNELTAGGSSEETDALYRERIKLAPAQFSNAGSRDAYKFHARTASPVIIDVSVLGPEDGLLPGNVEVYPLMNDGTVTPSPIISAVESAVNSERVRPLTDTVTVVSPTPLNYSITLDVTLYDTADVNDTISAIETALDEFTTEKRQKLGRDITLSQVVNVAQIEGVYSAVLTGWADVIVSGTEFPVCTSITVNFIGQTNG